MIGRQEGKKARNEDRQYARSAGAGSQICIYQAGIGLDHEEKNVHFHTALHDRSTLTFVVNRYMPLIRITILGPNFKKLFFICLTRDAG